MLRIPGLSLLIALGLAAGPGLADDPTPVRRVHQVAPEPVPPVVVVRGVLPTEPASTPDPAMAFEMALARMLDDLCRLDPGFDASAAAELIPPLPAGF